MEKKVIRTELGDIAKPSTEVVVNAANGCGVMGHGVAGALRLAGGPTIQEEAKQLVEDKGRPFEAGECYITGSGDMRNRGVKKIYHAVTMKYPGGNTSLDYVSRTMREVLDLAIISGVKSIAFPGLGTGVGRLNITLVAARMVQIAKSYDHLINIVILDRDTNFIQEVERLLEKRGES